ncbi:MAG: iron-containing alcohol dehydrogenase [Marinomonas sp.]
MTNEIKSFSFNTPGSMHLEWGGASRLGELLGEWFKERNLLIVTDKFLNESGLLEPTKNSLRKHGFNISIFDDVVADPPEHVLMECVEQGKQTQSNIVLGLGGGSSMDIAKLVAVMLTSDQPLSELYGIGKVTGTRTPLVQVPTTAGTGSEVTNITILTTGETTKMGVVSQQLYADRVLLDAELTTGLPALPTAATGIDAMVHAIEAFTSVHLKNPLSDALAKEALRLLSKNLVTACQDGQNRAAREAMLLGANLAGQAFSNSPVAAVHALAYPLGGHYHLPHGLTNALMLGPVLRYNMTAAAPLYAELADVVLGYSTEDDLTRASNFVDFMQSLMNESGAPQRLRDVDVTEESLPTLAKDAMLQTRLLGNNPVPVTEESALALYKAAF